MTDCIKTPPEIMNANKNILLEADVMFVNKIPFLTLISRHIKFATVENLLQCTASQILKALKHNRLTHKNWGFKVAEVFMDWEFEPLKNDSLQSDMHLNTASANEHTPGMECQNHTVKEQVQACCSTLPFKCIPKLMIVHMMQFVTEALQASFWITCLSA